MAASKLPPIEAIPQLSTDDRAALLDALFEPCTQLHTLSLGFLREKTFSSYDEMIIGIGMQLTELAESTSTSDKEWLNKILGAHPRLGEKKIDSAQSRAEQAQLQSGRSEEAEQLMALNAEYERMFPGLRYVTFVDGRPRAMIMNDMKARIDQGNIKLERADAIKAMCDIASDRVRKSFCQ